MQSPWIQMTQPHVEANILLTWRNYCMPTRSWLSHRATGRLRSSPGIFPAVCLLILLYFFKSWLNNQFWIWLRRYRKLCVLFRSPIWYRMRTHLLALISRSAKSISQRFRWENLVILDSNYAQQHAVVFVWWPRGSAVCNRRVQEALE